MKPTTLQRETWQRLQTLVPDEVLRDIQANRNPIRAWRQHLFKSEFELAPRLRFPESDAPEARKVNWYLDAEASWPHLTYEELFHISWALGVPVEFLHPDLYAFSWGVWALSPDMEEMRA